jgi:quercetin dioxygenase-like cupin family protein
MPVHPPPGDADDPAAFDPLLTEPFAAVWAEDRFHGASAAALRGRLDARIAATRRAEAGLVTVRRRRAPHLRLSEGVVVRWLYRTSSAGALRPGEPLQSALVELAPGARLRSADLTAGVPQDGSSVLREWLVVSGSARARGRDLSERDYAAVPPGSAPLDWSSEDGACLFVRDSLRPASRGAAPILMRDALAGWPEFAPGIRRRVLWQEDGQASMLYYADRGASVPQHQHGHDEECLMVQGELFLDDLLLQVGDYQLAPAGTGHRITKAATGIVIYAHGDLDMRFAK